MRFCQIIKYNLRNGRFEGVISEAPESSIPQVIFDYLAEEIFQKFDDATQEFLLCTAYLPNMTAQMAVELSSNKQSGKLLAKLFFAALQARFVLLQGDASLDGRARSNNLCRSRLGPGGKIAPGRETIG